MLDNSQKPRLSLKFPPPSVPASSAPPSPTTSSLVGTAAVGTVVIAAITVGADTGKFTSIGTTRVRLMVRQLRRAQRF